MGRRLCAAALKGICKYGEPDGTCELLDAFYLKCRKGMGGPSSRWGSL